jgi:hypothetical protein
MFFSLITAESAPFETPARRATSLMVTFFTCVIPLASEFLDKKSLTLWKKLFYFQPIRPSFNHFNLGQLISKVKKPI